MDMDRCLEYIKHHKVQYIHFFTVVGIFSTGIAEFINNTPDVFKAEEHLILMEKNSESEQLSDYENVFLVSGLKGKELTYMTAVADFVRYIFVHFLNLETAIQIPQDVAEKVIWRTWGNDLSRTLSYYPTIKLKIKALHSIFLWKFKAKRNVKHFRAVGISASECDRIELKRQKIQIPIFSMPYPNDNVDFSLEDVVSAPFDKLNKRDSVVVMIGHSANSSLHHIKYMKKLAHLKNQNLIILMPMVYGRMNYRESVEQYAGKHWGERAVIWKERVSYFEYLQLLNMVDLAIFDSPQQMALGNIVSLLSLGKTVVLNEKGTVYQTLREKNIKLHTTKELDGISYDTLRSWLNEDHSEGVQYGKTVNDRQYAIDAWKKLMDEVK